MKLNINTSQPFRFMQLLNDGLDVVEVWLPTFVDVVFWHEKDGDKFPVLDAVVCHAASLISAET